MGTSYHLWRQAGLGIASELLLTGRPLAADRAYQVGTQAGRDGVGSPGCSSCRR